MILLLSPSLARFLINIDDCSATSSVLSLLEHVYSTLYPLQKKLPTSKSQFNVTIKRELLAPGASHGVLMETNGTI